MMLPATQDRGVVVFKLWRGLPYGRRLLLGFGLAAVGVVAQAATGSFAPGAVPLIAANLLLLVSGYDNRVSLKGWDAGAQWERVDTGMLDELVQLDRKIRRWDASALDATNGGGGTLFVLLSAGLIGLVVTARGVPQILGLDAIVLLLPHWVTGVRRILVQPKLLVRVNAVRSALKSVGEALADHEVQLLMLLPGSETKIPEDIKIKVDVAGHSDDFLGLYGQVVINEVQGASYPYFYVVLVARPALGLREAYRNYQPPLEVVKEFKDQDGVEVLVIRQETTDKSGYHTKAPMAAHILREGVALAESVGVGLCNS